MSNSFRPFVRAAAVVALCLFAGSAFAQSSAKPLGKNDVNIGHYGDWETRCPKTGNERCEMTQLINSPDSGKPIMRVVIGYPPQIKTAAMIFILPLGTRLAPGVEMSVDGDKERRFPFQICLEQGCRADYPVDSDLMNKLKSGHKGIVSIIGPNGDRIDLNISLNGFTDANGKISP